MNIIFAKEKGYDTVSTPADAVIRELENLGHKITIVESLDYIPLDDYSFVFSAYEATAILGNAIKKKLNIPHFAHMEWVAPWRIMNCDPKQYGFQGDEEELKQLNILKPHYEKIIKAWAEADIKTLSAYSFYPYISKLSMVPTKEIFLRCPSIDYKSLIKAKDMYSPKKEKRIISISRLVPNKRYDLMVNVMNNLKSPIEWAIIGDGPIKEVIHKTLTNTNIKLNFLGPKWGWNRIYENMKSHIFLGSWTGMPPLESAVLGCYPIMILPNPTNEVKTMPMEEYFNLEMYKDVNLCAAKIDELINEDLTNECKLIENNLISGNYNIKTSEQNAKEIISLYEKNSNLISHSS